MFQKIVALLDQIRAIVLRLVMIIVPICGLLITSDLIIKTKFAILKRLSLMTGFGIKEVVVILVIGYLLANKK